VARTPAPVSDIIKLMPGNDELRRSEFGALFDAHRLDIASYCSWRSASRHDAEEAVAEVFLVAWRRLDDVPGGEATRPWLYATARRVLANQRRSANRRDALRERLTLEPTGSEAHPAPTSIHEVAVHDALARLGERDREVLLLVEWEGLNTAELAEVLGCHPVTARGRLHRARRRFGELFRSRLGQLDDREPYHASALITGESHR
jgi:RNA polymerase sigma-70 factor (ECF subfamily)